MSPLVTPKLDGGDQQEQGKGRDQDEVRDDAENQGAGEGAGDGSGGHGNQKRRLLRSTVKAWSRL